MTTARYIIGDVFDVMRDMPDNSVDFLMTSPPFLALRSYLPESHKDKAKEIGSEATPAEFLDTLLALTAEWGRLLAPYGSLCVELGDTYAGSGGAGGDYGPDGLRAGQERFNGSSRRRYGAIDRSAIYDHRGAPGWPLDKSLCGIPTLYAWSLAYGRNLLTGEPSPAGQWRVRNLVAWVRPNPPVGALGDKFRPATSYLTIATRARNRYFDLDAVRTHNHPERFHEGSSPHKSRIGGSPKGAGTDSDPNYRPNREDRQWNPAGAPPLDWWNHIDTLIDDEIRTRAGKPSAHGRSGTAGGVKGSPSHWASLDGYDIDGSPVGAQGSHIRRRLEQAGYLGGPTDDVWDITPGGFSGAHYAVYPAELCVRPILAMTPQRVCTTCGQPSRRLTDREYVSETERGDHYHEPNTFKGDRSNPRERRADGTFLPRPNYENTAQTVGRGGVIKRMGDGVKITTVGWSDCGCPDHGWRPGHVLDPFAGSGTTLAVATGHGRQATGIDLDPRNADLALERVGMFLTVEHHTGEVVA